MDSKEEQQQTLNEFSSMQALEGQILLLQALLQEMAVHLQETLRELKKKIWHLARWETT